MRLHFVEHNSYSKWRPFAAMAPVVTRPGSAQYGQAANCAAVALAGADMPIRVNLRPPRRADPYGPGHGTHL